MSYEFEAQYDSTWIFNNFSDSDGITLLPIYDFRFHDLAAHGWGLRVFHRTPKHPGISRPKVYFYAPGKDSSKLVLHVRACPTLNEERLINLLKDGKFSLAKERLFYARPNLSEYDIVKKMNDERYEKSIKKIQMDVPPSEDNLEELMKIIHLDEWRKNFKSELDILSQVA